jgi:hypothetical protein
MVIFNTRLAHARCSSYANLYTQDIEEVYEHLYITIPIYVQVDPREWLCVMHAERMPYAAHGRSIHTDIYACALLAKQIQENCCF